MLIESHVLVAADVHTLWAAVVDWRRHSAWIPLTRVRVLTAPDGPGDPASSSGDPRGAGVRLVGRTGFGPLAFDDVMEVVRFDPPGAGAGPGRCEVRKLGRVIRGSAWFEVEAVDEGRSVLRWGEDVVVRPSLLTEPASRLLVPLARWGLHGVLRRAARSAESDMTEGRS